MTKSEIRNLMKRKRNKLPKDIRSQYDNRILSKILDLKEYRECELIFTYLSFGSEVDTRSIIDEALKSNKKVYLPRVEGSHMNFYEINDLSGLVRSKFGILEPDVDSDKRYEKPLLQEDLYKRKVMLLPGLAFDQQGYRIGYGAGYYDKYLGKFEDSDFFKIGLAYDFQILNHITTNLYDISADMVVTPEKIYICRK
ncbi:MAG: 5-formyltetrahydrofolate cyclo-ligase [Clostridiales bacterium]|nr:5-formyltetrahydrofolate cyclo-ligase [Clostridiales bacterium]